MTIVKQNKLQILEIYKGRQICLYPPHATYKYVVLIDDFFDRPLHFGFKTMHEAKTYIDQIPNFILN